MHSEDKKTLWWAVLRSPVLGAVTGCILGGIFQGLAGILEGTYALDSDGHSDYFLQGILIGGYVGAFLGAALGLMTGVVLGVLICCCERLLDDFRQLHRVVGIVSLLLNGGLCWLVLYWFTRWGPFGRSMSDWVTMITAALVAGFGAYFVSRRFVKWLAPIKAPNAHGPNELP